MASSPISLREAVYAWLLSLPDLAAIVGNRIFFEHAGRGDPYPWFAFEIKRGRGSLGRTYGRTLAGPDGTSTASVVFIAAGYQVADLVAAMRVVSVLDEYSGDLGGITVLKSILEFEWDTTVTPPAGDDRWIYEVNADYRIRHLATPATS